MASAFERGVEKELHDLLVVHCLLAADVCLVEQAFVKDPDRSVGDVLGDASKQAGAPVRVTSFRRFKLGEATGA